MDKREMVRSSGLMLARIVAGGALLLAGVLKLQGDPLAFALGIESFKLFPLWMIPPLTYFVPVFEIVIGVTLLLGTWARQSALLALGLYIAFLAALVSVLARGMNVDCGCFGDFFGGSTVDAAMLLRNVFLSAAALAVAVFGPGSFAIACPEERGCTTRSENETDDDEQPALKAEA